MRILTIIGTRPDTIKMIPLIKELKNRPELEVIVCFSGQHETLADNVLEFFKITPDYRFYGLNKTRSLNEMTITLLNYFDVTFKKISPDLIVVHGDTTTALCASVAAFYLNIKVAHVEAGLRTHNQFSPFPEEFNRVAIDNISSFHFAPTDAAAQNLIKEGKISVFTSGNTCIDALKYTISEAYSHPLLNEAPNKKLILITTHRRENIGEKMLSALLGIRDAVAMRDDVFCIFPIHPNPNVKNSASKVFRNINNFKICPPLPLYDFHNLLYRAHLVISDSGGIQEESAYLGIPLFLLRDSTERKECLDTGNLKIIGTDRVKVKNEISAALDDEYLLSKMKNRSLVFGDGNASEKIVKKLLSLL